MGARRHNKTILDSKHGILQDIYLRLKSESPNTDSKLLAARMFHISNDLYGNDVLSSYELAPRHTRPISSNEQNYIP